ncbi:MAG: hypothetical protein U0K38_07130, partial [Collinsella sp.]|nr:hypothetical protein [Collinsella sp.]
ALETVPNETPASRATSLILTFAIAAPLMRFKYKPDCSIARPWGVKAHHVENHHKGACPPLWWFGVWLLP